MKHTLINTNDVNQQTQYPTFTRCQIHYTLRIQECQSCIYCGYSSHVQCFIQPKRLSTIQFRFYRISILYIRVLGSVQQILYMCLLISYFYRNVVQIFRNIDKVRIYLRSFLGNLLSYILHVSQTDSAMSNIFKFCVILKCSIP